MFETPDTVIIPAHPPVCEEMKNYNIQDQPMTGTLGEISEWAARMALRDYPIGSEQSLEEVSERALSIQLQLVLSKMVDSGLVNMEWCPEHGDFSYGLTEDGKELGAQMG
tara:strand:+ start:151 stop:480 length:330 start_codon:yes stop_codon:yes gene_type:complete